VLDRFTDPPVQLHSDRHRQPVVEHLMTVDAGDLGGPRRLATNRAQPAALVGVIGAASVQTLVAIYLGLSAFRWWAGRSAIPRLTLCRLADPTVLRRRLNNGSLILNARRTKDPLSTCTSEIEQDSSRVGVKQEEGRI